MSMLQPDFPSLAGICAAIGAIIAALALPGVVAPARAAAAWKWFPRSKWPGRVMTAVAACWTALWAPPLVLEFAPGAAPSIVGLIQYAVPVAIVAICLAIPDLLSCRAAGMILVLAPIPVLSAAQWHPSAARYFPIALAYAMALEGMFAVSRPWVLRDQIMRANASAARARLVSAAFLVIATALVLLAATAFPVEPGAEPLR